MNLHISLLLYFSTSPTLPHVLHTQNYGKQTPQQAKEQKRKWMKVMTIWSIIGLSLLKPFSSLMIAHQPPAKLTVLILNQLLPSKLTSITRYSMFTTFIPICKHYIAVFSHVCLCEQQKSRPGLWLASFGTFYTACHHSEIKWIHHSAPVLGADLTAHLHHAPRAGAADTCQLEKNHLHRMRSKMRARALQLRLSHWWKPPLGFERSEITKWAETLLSWSDSWNNHQRHYLLFTASVYFMNYSI